MNIEGNMVYTVMNFDTFTVEETPSDSYDMLDLFDVYSLQEETQVEFSGKNEIILYTALNKTNAALLKAGKLEKPIKANDTTSNFSLPLHFTDTKATGDGVDLHNIPLIDTDTTVNGNNIIRKATATISGTSTDIQLKSEYISLFDVDVTQQVDYQIHYGSSKGSSYADDTKNVTNGTGTGTQSGGVQVMKKDNTIVDKYGQKHTIFISRKKKNMLHKRKR